MWGLCSSLGHVVSWDYLVGLVRSVELIPVFSGRLEQAKWCPMCFDNVLTEILGLISKIHIWLSPPRHGYCCHGGWIYLNLFITGSLEQASAQCAVVQRTEAPLQDQLQHLQCCSAPFCLH